MSEQIELDGSNLCIPEDAFEKFQAVSMYEETEFITLTNIVPTQTAESCVGDNTIMTSNHDAVVELNTDNEMYVNTKCDDGESQSPLKTDPATNNDHVIPTQPISGDLNEPNVTSKHGKKRGRKKKKTSECSAMMRESHSGCENILDNTNGPSESIEDIQNFIHSTDPASAQKRRGRRPKSSNISSDELSSSMKDLSKDSIKDASVAFLNKEPESSSEPRMYRKRGRPSKSHENFITTMSSSNEDEVTIVDHTEQQLLSDNSNSSKKILKRRGRARKISHEEKTDQVEILSTVDNAKSSEVLDSLPEVIFTKKSKKKGRPKKKTNIETIQTQNENNVSSQNSSLEYDDDDISLSNLSKMNHQKTDIDESIDNEDKIQLQDLLDNDNNTKLDDNEKHLNSIKKRGRPKKAHTESVTQTLNKLGLLKDNHDSRISNEDKDDGDDISLSQFKNNTLNTNDEVPIVKDTSDTNIIEKASQHISSPAQEESNFVKTDSQILSSGKRNSKMPIMSDFEYNLDSIVNENNEIEISDAQKDDEKSLLVEDVSKRPIRKKVRQTLQYHEESDEDPFANMELSDDEPRRSRKGRKYNSDDEYFPGDVREPATPSSSDSESNKELDNDKKSRKRKCSKKSDSQSPRKKGRKPNSEKILEEGKSSEIKTDYSLVNDIEDCLHSSVIKTNDETTKAWGTTTEFENFLAKKIQGTNLKIKKVSSTENADAITPLQIPTIDPSEPKKTIEMCTQTTKITTNNVDVQTSCPYDIPMKESITLTAEQSAKSCEFLTSIVNTTTELGKLMTQKSEDFIKKKINTDHVTDTLKMDYCVRKSFLLFKLAKHNLTQMEEDLAKQYEQFLIENDLLKYREEPKKIIPTVQADSDSDCEIVEVPVVEEVKKTSKSSKTVPKFNPKTVFLNKELSIKIAKKPSDDKKINIKGKHTVWINDSVMVKKVKPTQSFLAQDSRNKKPPDQKVYVTAKMVNDFFEDYYRKKSLATCALFTSPDWLKVNSNYVCDYFVVKQDFTSGVTNNGTVAFVLNGANPSTSNTDTNHNINIVKNILEMSETSCPERLITLCIDVLRKLMPISKCNGINTMVSMNDQHSDKVLQKKPRSLFELCINVFNLMMNNNTKDVKCSYESKHNLHIKYPSVKNTVLTLKILCLKKVSELMLNSAVSYEFISKSKYEDYLATENSNDNTCHIKKHNAREIKPLISLCVESIQFGNYAPNRYNIYPKIKQGREVKPLSSLCVETICYNSNGCVKYVEPVCQRGKDCKRQIIQPQIKHHIREVKSLFSLSVESICYAIHGSIKYVEPFCLRSNGSKEQVMHSEIQQYRKEVKSLFSLCVESIRFVNDCSNKKNKHPVLKKYGKDIKPLFSLCVESIKMAQKNEYQRKYIQVLPTQLQYIPKSLLQISIKNILGLLFNHEDFMNRKSSTEITQTLYINDELAEAFTINSVNTLSEEAFHNLQNTEEDPYYEDFDNDESYLNNDGFDVSYEGTEELSADDNNWASQVQMEELRSCVNINNTANTHPPICDGSNTTHVVAIKSEPIEDVLDNVHDSIVVKIEPVNELDEMTMIPDSVVTKSEVSVSSHAPESVVNLVNRSYSVDTFEEFVRRNKIIQSLNDSTCDEVYSQSSLRIRRQFEPDYDGDNDAVDGLLIPHTFTNIYNAKDCLMESSSDEVNAEKNMGKKKPVKRKVKPKKPVSKTFNRDVAPPAKEKSKLETSEVDEFTKKMKDRLRQEEIENQSSESELEDLPLAKRRNKGIVKESTKKSTSDKSAKDVIQCNDVDSTEQGNNSLMYSILNNVETTSSCCSSVKQNDTLKTKVKLKIHRKKKCGDFEGPLELLECEPTIHENSNDDFVDLPEQLSKSIDVAFNDPRKNNISKQDNNYAIDNNVPKEPLTNKEGIEIVDRCGWSCYPIDTKDTKLYQEVSVLLDKLPESFVQTYFEYQEIAEQNQVDREIDRLTNVNSLNRSSKDKAKTKPRTKVGAVENNKPSQINATSLLESFNASEQAHEFAPSDDDEANIDAELPPSVPSRHAENTLAKSSLMDDESENEGRSVSPQTSHKIKQEPMGDAPIKKRPGPKSKTRVEGPRIPVGELVLTADKMMQEELTLLHAPVTLNTIEVNNKIETTHKEPVIKTRSQHPRKVYQRVKSEEDSSSEEEKQWVSTKEKLLKKLKKAPDASASDAKRAKMVTEFIEKRGEGSESRKVTRGKYRGSRKKYLEREKQLKVLSKELYGESSTDSYPRKSYVTMNYKGRRNIRKVIDKKSLERSTVKAIMEEFERKRRLNDKQNKLRAHLGCEENVNVLVINDEVCLEYDFEEDRPAVTVHPFFTKVMKAHQYEGVKFMWDACFESVDKMEAGHPGGGCILAHCMGLGKTLQVLALLHTVLTHPQVGMKRVLVCCPLSTVLNWVDEIHKWIGPVTDQLKVFELSKLKKTYERAYQLEDWYNGGGIFIIGYELFRSLSTLDPCLDDVRPTIIKKIRTALLDPGPDIVVCDEGHLLKNDCSVLAVAMSRVATRRRIVLTGTPMQNNLREYYCMVNFIKPNLLGSYAEYSNRFANPIMNGQHRDSSEEDIKLMKTRTHILHKVLEGCLQRQEASVLYPYLPKKHEYTVFIPLTKCQWDLYKHYIYTYCKHNKQSILKDFHILQKIWSHPLVLHNFHTKLSDYRKAKEEKLEDDLAAEDLTVEDIKPADTEVWWLQYLDGGNMLETLESSNKFLAVFRILNECVELGDKVLIFSTSLFCLDSLEYFLKKINKWSLGQEYYRLDGSVPPEVRHKWCREFNADNNTKTRLFLISTRAGSLGLNMTAANRVIILDTSWNPAHDMQSIFRVYRFGQKKDCFIYRLVAMGTMEQKIYERSVTKQAVACRVVDEQQIDRHYNSADLAELYRLDEAGGSVVGGVAAGVRDVALLRVARDGPVHAVHEHDSLLRASEPALPEHERAAAWQQFQNERAAEQNKPPSKETKKGKMSVKGAQNTKSQTVVEIKQESNNENEAQKTDIVKCSIPIQTAKPVIFADDPVKNDISNNVVHTLIKHCFPNMQEIKDVTHVVNVVRNIVAKVKANEENKDMVSGIIAQSMFQNSKQPLTRMADIVIQDLNSNIEMSLTQLQQLQKPSLSPQKPVALPQKQSARLRERLLRNQKQLKEEASSGPNNDAKPKEKKKSSAPEEPTTVTDIVIELNDDVEQRSHDSSGTISADEIATKPEAARPSPKKYKKVVKNKKKSTERVVEQPTISDNSILLSDEDDVSIVPTSLPEVPLKAQNTPIKVGNKIPNQTVQKTQNQPGQKPPAPADQNTTNQTTVAVSRTYSTGKEKAAKIDKSVELVPLHPSLLTNKHFITIVAHTYLEGNPMLDEDAATLAAQYSTHKAKKEIEAGRTITSGPLYDIAVKALSMETLQKLHNVAPKVPQATIVEAAASLQLEESLIDMEQSGSLTRQKPDDLEPVPAAAPLPKLPAMKKVSRIHEYRPAVKKPSIAETYSAAPVPQLLAIPTASSKVVPVELFKGPSMQSSGQYSRQNHEESILPDDNSSAINTNVPPPLSNPLPASSPAPKILLSHRKKTPIIVRTMSTAPKLAPQPSAVQTAANAKVSAITAVGGQLVLEPQISTICLDSDDEDTSPRSPVHRPPPGPVPVALTRVNTAHHMPVTRVVSAPTSNPAPAPVLPPPSLTPAAAPPGLAVNTYINATSNPINAYAIPASNSPTLVAISGPLNSFAKSVIMSTANSISTPTGTSPNLHKTTHTELPPKTSTQDEKQAKPNHFILKINNKTLRVVQSSPPPESVKTIYKLGKNDKLLPNVSISEPPTQPTTSENVDKDRKNLVALKLAPAVGTATSALTENVRENQSSMSTRTLLKNTNTKKSMTLKIDPKKTKETSTVRASGDAVTSNSYKCDDPLDIFKDIVHIQAYDTEKTSQGVKSSNNKAKNSLDKLFTNKIKSAADLKPSEYKIKSFKEFSALPNKKGSVDVKQSYEFKKIAPKSSGPELLLSFSKGSKNTLSSLLAKKKASLQATSTSKTITKDVSNPKEVLKTGVEGKKAKISAKAADSFIDLTSYSAAGPSKSIDSKHTKKQSTPTLADSKQNKTKPKVVNLTKNIVAIEKPVLKIAKDAIATVDITGESSKGKSSSKTKSNAQLTASNEKKRPTTTVDIKPTKKKKVEELTLQDFDIDDLDDIIELE